MSAAAVYLVAVVLLLCAVGVACCGFERRQP